MPPVRWMAGAIHVEGIDAGHERDVGANESENQRRSEEQRTVESPLPEKPDKAADDRGEDEEQADTEKPRGEYTDNEAPNSPRQ